jgi:zinc transport system ATP-binding protein
MTAPVIEVRDLSFSYGGPPVLEDVNLTVQPRDLACVIGPNGGGKTTLLRLLLGLLRPRRGTIRVLGENPGRARRRVGYMPQHARIDQAFPVNVLDVVLMGRLRHGPAWGPYRAADRVGGPGCTGGSGGGGAGKSALRRAVRGAAAARVDRPGAGV